MQIIDYLVKQLRGAAAHNAAVQIAPAVVLWTDETKTVAISHAGD